MLRFLMEAGPVIWPLILLTLVIGVLTLFNLLSLLLRRSVDGRRRSIDAILFWGGLAAALGFLGQWMGLNRLVHAIAAKGVVNPAAVAYGLSESLLTPISGMFILLFAAMAWFLLRVGLWNRERRMS